MYRDQVVHQDGMGKDHAGQAELKGWHVDIMSYQK